MNKDVALKIMEVVCKVVDEKGLNCEVMPENNYRCIEIDGEDAYAWIRLLELRGRVYADINNIQIAKKHRRKGVCQALCDEIAALDCVDNFIISSVCTTARHKFCKKNGYAKDEMMQGYTNSGQIIIERWHLHGILKHEWKGKIHSGSRRGAR